MRVVENNTSFKHGSPTWSGLSEICKLPNITRIEFGTCPVTEMGTAADAAALTKSKMREGEQLSHMLNFPVDDDMAGGAMVRTPMMNASGDSPGNFDPDSLLQNGKETYKRRRLEDDTAALRTKLTLGSSQAVEPESMGGMVQPSRGRVKKKSRKLGRFKRPFLVHFQRQLLVRCVRRCQKLVVKLLNEEEEIIQLTGKQLFRDSSSSEKKHTAFILLTLVPENREATQILNPVNKKRGTLIRFKKPLMEFLKGKFLNSLDGKLMEHVKRRSVKLVVKVLNWEVKKLVYLEVATILENSHTDAISPAVEAECSGVMMQLDSPCEGEGKSPESSATNEEEEEEETNVVGLESIDAIGNSSKNNDNICRWKKDNEQPFDKSLDAAAPETLMAVAIEAECCRGGMKQHDSPCEGQIPKSIPTNEETKVVGLKSIDAIGNSSSSKNNNTICRWQKDHGITLEALEQLFDKSRNAAAETFKVSPSTLKRACRDLGIPRWPTHKGKKRANSSLNQQEDAQAVKRRKGSEPYPPALSPEQGNSAMSVKVSYENDTIRFPLSSSSTMKYFEEQLETRLKVSLDNLCIKYQDEEDEWISLTCDLDLMYCVDVLRSCGKTVIRMMVTPKI